MPYFYQNHLGGGVYQSDYEIDDEDLYCEECGDSDEYLGEFDTIEEARRLYTSGPYTCREALDELAEIDVFAGEYDPESMDEAGYAEHLRMLDVLVARDEALPVKKEILVEDEFQTFAIYNCPSCGRQIGDYHFCPYCGQRLSK